MTDATEPLDPVGDFSVPEDADLHVDEPSETEDSEDSEDD